MTKKVNDSEKTIKKLKATKNKVKKAKENIENKEEFQISDEQAAKLTVKTKDINDKEDINWEPVAKTQEEIKKNNNFYAKIKDFFHF